MKTTKYTRTDLKTFLKPCILRSLWITAVFSVLNVLHCPGFFKEPSDLFDANGHFPLVLGLMMILVLILLAVLTPISFRKETGEEEDLSAPEIPTWVKFFSILLPLFLNMTVQMLLFGVYNLFSVHFSVSFGAMLLTWLLLCGLIFAWTVFLVFLKLSAGSVFWYYVGFLTVCFAPMFITDACYKFYNANVLLPYADWNPLAFNPFIAVLGAFGSWYLLLFAGVFVFLLIIAIRWMDAKNRLPSGTPTVHTVYHIAVIFLLSLSAGFLAAGVIAGKDILSFGYGFVFVFVTLIASLLMTFFDSKKSKKAFFRIAPTLCFPLLCSVLIVLGIPAFAENRAYVLPEKETVASVGIRLNHGETIEKKENFDEILSLHGKLLGLFEKGILPETSSSSYEEAKCQADLWEDFSITYTLKNGTRVYREYRDLKDPAFDNFFIELVQSETYRSALQRMSVTNPDMRYLYRGGLDVWCELPEDAVRNLVRTYCEELGKAERSVFYEPYDRIRLSGISGTDARELYVPTSFAETKKLAKSYLDRYAVWPQS